MSLSLQIAYYAGVIGAMLALLRVMSGIAGSRSITKSILQSAIFSSVALAGAVSAAIIYEIPPAKKILTTHSELATYVSLTWFGLWFLSMVYCFGLGVVVRMYVRNRRFKDWGTFRNLRAVVPFSTLRSLYKRFRNDRQSYETGQGERVDDKESLRLIQQYLDDGIQEKRTLLVSGDDPWYIRSRLVELIVELVENTEEQINYVCCSVSPANIWNIIESSCDAAMQKTIKQRLVFVDVYTQTFGFGDDILAKKIHEMQDNHIDIVSCNSAAGVHFATGEAFKILKKHSQSNKLNRLPCVMVYDSLSVLSITETDSELAEFIIHLSAAELTYNMLTIFLEADFEGRTASVSFDAMKSCCGAPIKLLRPGAQT